MYDYTKSYVRNKNLYEIGTVAGAVGDIMSAWGQASGMEADAATARAEAVEARGRTTWQDSQLAREGARLMATQQLLFQSAGVTMEGSPTLFLQDTQRELAMDQAMLRREGLKQYLQLRGQARALDRAAGDTRLAGTIGAFGRAMGAIAFL